MDLREAMKARHMVRKYLDKSMPEDIVQKLNTRVKENNEKYGVAVELRINDTPLDIKDDFSLFTSFLEGKSNIYRSKLYELVRG